MEPQQPLMQAPNATQEPMNPGKKTGKSKKKLFGIIGAVVAVVLLVGGAGAALYVNAQYNKPENVLAKAVGKYLLSDGPRNFTLSSELKMVDASEGFSTIELDLGVQTMDKFVRLDVDANASVLRLRGSLLADDKGSIFVKVKDLPTLLGSATGGATLPEESRQLVASLEDKWVEITKEDLAELTGAEATDSEYSKCTDKLYGLMGDEALGDQVDAMYKDNMFFLAKSSSTEQVNGRELLKVEVGLDVAKLNAFGEAVEKTAQYKELVEACGGEDGVASTASESNPSDEIRNGKVYVWLDRGKKELVKMEMSGEGYSNGAKIYDGKLTMDVKDGAEVKLETPTDKVNIKEILQALGIDPAALSAAAGSAL